MTRFSVNAHRSGLYRHFRFRIKWDGRYVAGVSAVSVLKHTTENIEHGEGGDAST